MANYLITHYKGKYRILCPYDESTNQFPRKLDGTFEDIDCYIKCAKNVKIFYYGSSTLEAYIPTVKRGCNIVRSIREDGHGDIIFDVNVTDEEVYFKFKAKYMDIMEHYLNPTTNGSNVSPFSTKNLPKSDYRIPDEELKTYKKIIENVPRERLIDIVHMTKLYLSKLATKTNTIDMIKADMRKKMMKPKEYIHSIGKWDDYLEYLKENINV